MKEMEGNGCVSRRAAQVRASGGMKLAHVAIAAALGATAMKLSPEGMPLSVRPWNAGEG